MNLETTSIFLLSLIGGAFRISVPILWVSLGECITEKSGKINLGHEGSLIMGAMLGYGFSLHSGSPWLGVLMAGICCSLFGITHALMTQVKGVNDIALGISIMIFGKGLAFYLGKDLIKPTAPRLGDFSLFGGSENKLLAQAFTINSLFVLGIIACIIAHLTLKYSRWGLMLKIAGENEESGKSLGYKINTIRLIAMAMGTFFSGIGGAYLSLYYPGSWNEGLSSGQGLMAVALVIFAQWQPLKCIGTALLFGAASSISPALQAIGYSYGYHLLNALPYIFTLVILIFATKKNKNNAPKELSIIK